ncbi:hypothetical protein ACEPPN_003938 [Leptodophora sp. 'Broadleaf-Isolate-01']
MASNSPVAISSPSTTNTPTTEPLNIPTTTSTELTTRPSKRHRTSTSQLTISDTPITDTNTTNLTSRPRRQAAIKSRSRTITYVKTNPKTTNSSRNSNSKSKTNSKAKSRAKKTEVVEEDDDDDFECPCGRECGTVALCENRKKENEVRDVGMNVILSSKSTAIISVGTLPNQQSFLIHKELLAVHSEYFDSLFSSPSQRHNSSQLSEPCKAMSESNTALQKALTSAMRGGAHLDSQVKVKEESHPKPSTDFDVNFGLGVKMEINEEDSDDDFTMISSDQYYSNLAHKKLLTPTSTPVKTKTKNKTTNPLPSTSQSISPSPSKLKADCIADCTQPTHTLPFPQQEQEQQQETYTLPATIHPLPFALFTSYIYTGNLSPTLQTLTDKEDPCSWERLWALGFLLKAPGFMNFCMEGLRDLKKVHDGLWPSAKEAGVIWNLDLDDNIPPHPTPTSTSPEDSRRDSLTSSNSNSHSTDPFSDGANYIAIPNAPEGKNTPLHHFTASCIAHNAPLTTQPKNNVNYRAWTRLLTTNTSLSLAVHDVDAKRFAEKGPWDDEFRLQWRVEEGEGGLGEKWRVALEEKEKERRGVKGGDEKKVGFVAGLLGKLVLTGVVGTEVDGGEESDDELFEDGDEDEDGEDVDEYFGWRRRRK